MNSPINLRLLVGWSLLLGGLLLVEAKGEETPVLITARVPIQQVDATGHPSAVMMGTIGSSFSLVGVNGDKLLLKDHDGNQFLVSCSATNYVPPAAVAAVNPDTNVPSSIPLSSPGEETTSSPAHPSPSASTAVPAVPPSREIDSQEDQDLITKLNGVLGIPLVADSHFWMTPSRRSVNACAGRWNPKPPRNPVFDAMHFPRVPRLSGFRHTHSLFMAKMESRPTSPLSLVTREISPRVRPWIEGRRHRPSLKK